MKHNSQRNYITLVGLVVFLVLWTVLLIFYKPMDLINFLGVGNSYLVLFLVSVFSSLSSLTFVSTYPMIVTYTLGNLDTLMIAVCAGAGLSIGDALFYYLGLEVRTVIKGKLRQRLHKLLIWIAQRPAGMVPVLVYLYVGFTPLPNNLLTGTLAAAGYPFKKVILPVFLGNMSFPFIAIMITGWF